MRSAAIINQNFEDESPKSRKNLNSLTAKSKRTKTVIESIRPSFKTLILLTVTYRLFIILWGLVSDRFVRDFDISSNLMLYNFQDFFPPLQSQDYPSPSTHSSNFRFTDNYGMRSSEPEAERVPAYVNPFDFFGSQQGLQAFEKKALSKMNLLQSWANWDSVFFLGIAKNRHYKFENFYAFFPFFPYFMFKTSSKLGPILKKFLNFSTEIEKLLFSGFLLSNIFFLGDTILMYILALTVFGNSNEGKRISFYSALLFAFNPATPFFTALYTESFFCFFLLLGLIFYYLSKYPRIFSNFFIWTVFQALCTLSFSFATGFRSNGIVLCGFLIFQCLETIFEFFPKNFKKSEENNNQAKNEEKFWIFGKIFKFFANNLKFYKMKLKFNLIFMILLTILQCSLIFLPFLVFQKVGFISFCDQNLNTFLTRFGIKQDKYFEKFHKWCLWKTPNLYSYIQSNYWDVGFLKFYTIGNIPNVILAVPIFIISLKALFEYARFDYKRILTLGLLSSIKKEEKEESFKELIKMSDKEDIAQIERLQRIESIQSSSKLDGFCEKKEILVLMYYWAFLLFYGATSMHVHVSTRFLCSSCPILFLYLGFIFGKETKESFGIEEEKKEAKFKSFVVCYFLFFGIVGTSLFVNFYPWC